ncbi:DUF461 domain-containing protein [Yinghuangia soli]|uniref:DUF461 domain-containing protein n=1 Tax=Yinghuangia soli TaxID=2908204 RepID=A0AA41Q905_9ACTN|nr:DUF461 domain-containing protein [Yinghuangia soli]MCF2532971.1 DUF461 domain-containing protein [Yinghuangia soli]
MPHPRRFRHALAAALIAALPVAALSGCAAGNSAETLKIKPDTPATTLGALKIQNVVLLTGPLGAAGPLTVTGSIYNGGGAPDQLERISVNELPVPAVITPAPNHPELRVLPTQTLQIGGPGNTTALVANAADLVRAGDSRRVTFRFAREGEVTLWVPVLPANGYYVGYGPLSA